MRRVMLAVVVLVLTFGPAQAQGTIPEGAFVKDSHGNIWAVKGGSRVRVVIHPADSRDVEAIPTTDRYLVPGPDGGLIAGDEPMWAPFEVRVDIEQAGLPSRPVKLKAGDYDIQFEMGLPGPGQPLRPGEDFCNSNGELRPVVDGRPTEGGDGALYFGIRPPRAPTVHVTSGGGIVGESAVNSVKEGTYVVVVEGRSCEVKWVLLKWKWR